VLHFSNTVNAKGPRSLQDVSRHGKWQYLFVS